MLVRLQLSSLAISHRCRFSPVVTPCPIKLVVSRFRQKASRVPSFGSLHGSQQLSRFHSNTSLSNNSNAEAHGEAPKPPLTPVQSPSPSTWVDTYVAPRWRPYFKLVRIDRPIGTYLLMLPCWWSVALAMPPASIVGFLGALPNPTFLAMFAVGAFIMRGAGCTINDLWDRRFDQKVARTRDRPLASGAIRPLQAFVFLQLQLLTGLAVLLNFNETSIYLACGALPLVLLYPLAKRFTNWPQLVLGFAFNWGALVGWTAVTGTFCWSIMLPLYLSGVCWTIVYDTIYAHQDKADDISIGVKSTALYFGEQTRLWLSGFSVATLAGLAVAGFQASMGLPFFLISILGGGAHLVWQLKFVNFNNASDCMSKFVSNKWFGLLVFAGIVLDKLWS